MTTLLDRINAKKKAIDAKSGNIARPAKLAAGPNKVRILPNWEGDAEGDFFQDFGQHFIKDAAGNIKAVYLCTANTFAQDCDICRLRADLGVATVNESHLMVLQEAKPSNRVLVNAQILTSSEKEKVQLVELPPTVFGDYLEIAGQWLADHNINILDLTTGHDVIITKSGAGRDTTYSVVAEPVVRAVGVAVLGECKDLASYADQQYDAGLQKALTALAYNAGGGGTPALAGPAAALPAPTAADLAAIDPAVLEHDASAAAAAAQPVPPVIQPAPVVPAEVAAATTQVAPAVVAPVLTGPAGAAGVATGAVAAPAPAPASPAELSQAESSELDALLDDLDAANAA